MFSDIFLTARSTFMKLLQDDYSMFDYKFFLNGSTYANVNFAMKILSKFIK